ncbi:HAD-IIIA family hydrolase [Iningainema tapete]|uniref:HAD-IIIA family hydrolase n=1 Tax=Iningainema tapete BLCC-T55 TaxID=2748662 RepID=A0A8J7BZX1_9CYAN|nr:HAD-IIIA family hydrolase [Iningainema tapete]MBD2778637.1 HAD-IIIA family hydrolase [Iningainema tapete BLCC-T55]
MKKILFLDCDGTIRQPVNGQWVQPYNNQKIIRGADKAIQHYHKEGWMIIGISNQGGVEKGHKSLQDAILEQRYTLELLPQINCIYICPDFQGNECYQIDKIHQTPVHETEWGKEFIGQFRKPDAGMILAAVKFHGDFNSINTYWYIGDRQEDELASNAAGCNFMDADIWRDRFLSGMYQIKPNTVKQVEFLEKYRVN